MVYTAELPVMHAVRAEQFWQHAEPTTAAQQRQAQPWPALECDALLHEQPACSEALLAGLPQHLPASSTAKDWNSHIDNHSPPIQGNVFPLANVQCLLSLMHVAAPVVATCQAKSAGLAVMTARMQTSQLPPSVEVLAPDVLTPANINGKHCKWLFGKGCVLVPCIAVRAFWEGLVP